MKNNGILLTLSSVTKSFPIYSTILRRVVAIKEVIKNVSLEVEKGITLGLVGESGSGKSTIAKLICNLEKPDNGKIFFENKDITTLSRVELARYVQMVFQNPYASLNPKLKISYLLNERTKMVFRNKNVSGKEIQGYIEEMLDIVKLNKDILNFYPYQLSGGQKQRIAILLAIILNPKLIIFDEPLSALDVALQAQLLNFFNELKEKFKFTYIFITHDIDVAEYFCDKIVKVENKTLVPL